jgi:hypothetical protein
MIAGDNHTCVVDTGQKYPKSLKFFLGVNDTTDKTVLTMPACLDLKNK